MEAMVELVCHSHVDWQVVQRCSITQLCARIGARDSSQCLAAIHIALKSCRLPGCSQRLASSRAADVDNRFPCYSRGPSVAFAQASRRKSMGGMRIAFWGNFGALNLGNECTLAAAVGNIRARLPDAKLVAICRDPEDAGRRHGIAALPMSGRAAH